MATLSQCLKRPVFLFDYVIPCKPNSPAFHLAPCGLHRRESLQPSEDAQFRQEIWDLQNISASDYLTTAFMKTVQLDKKTQFSAELVQSKMFWVRRIASNSQFSS